MKKWLPFIVIVALVALVTVAYSCGSCGGKAGCAKSCCGSKCDNPDWGYAYQTADFYPDKAPCELKKFHTVLLPVREARKSHEVAYIRETANCLYMASKEVRKSYPCCADQMLKKHYKRAAKELIRDSKRLKEMVHGGSDDVVLAQVERIEEDFIRLANLSD
ncbi:hypothetical protein KKG05_09605 [bacterium]|nr:hypothetical protein [bacterium]